MSDYRQGVRSLPNARNMSKTPEFVSLVLVINDRHPKVYVWMLVSLLSVDSSGNTD